MRICARLFGTARRHSIAGKPGIWEGELPEGATVADLIISIGSSQREIVAASVDGISVSFDTVISESMDIVLVTAVGGG
jgi:sulfur carrier protein ThiS